VRQPLSYVILYNLALSKYEMTPFLGHSSLTNQVLISGNLLVSMLRILCNFTPDVKLFLLNEFSNQPGVSLLAYFTWPSFPAGEEN
jgi:hypothetical protein